MRVSEQRRSASAASTTSAFIPDFPVDRRHNAKIHRLDLASLGGHSSRLNFARLDVATKENKSRGQAA